MVKGKISEEKTQETHPPMARSAWSKVERANFNINRSLEALEISAIESSMGEGLC